VAIARALANEPEIILMDEPFGALDAQTRNTLQNELLRIWQEEKRTIIFVTHSVDEAVFLSDRIVILSKRPGMIKKEIEINISRPRDRTRPEENQIRNEVLRLLDSGKNSDD
jgi:ABC-type nitrate/sulfonate/bicarbonate transport system, ATPase component